MTESSPTKIVTNRERLAGVVQSVGRRPVDIERRWYESLGVFVVGTIVYFVIGYWLVSRMHVVGFETLDRLNRALMIWYNEPPKLASVGFDYPPLSVLLLAPFTVVRVFASSLVVVPLVSAIFGGFTLMLFNTMLRRSQVVFPVRAITLVLVGFNPLVVMYAANGSRNFLWLAFVVAALGALFAWYVTADIRFVMIAGLSYAVASLTGYGSLTFFVLSLIMIAAILSRLGADGTEVEGTAVGFAAPTMYAIALWTIFNLILLFEPFNWLTDSSDTAASAPIGDWSLLDLAKATIELVFYGAPIAIVVLPALIFAGIARRNGFALWLGLMLAVSILTPALAVLLGLTDSPMVMSNALTIFLVAVIGALWLARSAGEGSMLVAGILIVGLLLSIPWTFNAMETFKHQGLERAFHDAVSTRESQEGATTVDGSTVGYDNEEEMAEYILDNIDVEDSILTDNASTGPVMLFTGHPEYFFDRVDQSDGPWRRAARNPAAHVDYMLLTRNIDNDILSRLYADAANGTDSNLPVEFANDRYVLVEVPDDYTYDESAAEVDTSTDEREDATGTEPTEPTSEQQDEEECVTLYGVCGEGPAENEATPGSGNQP